MARKREFGEGPIFTISNYIFWFMGGSFYFGLCNILFLFVLLTPIENPDPSYLTILMISLIPTGPAITALLSAMGKLVREKDINITKDYFRAYKQNFVQSLFVWVLGLAAISILLVDISFFKNQSYGIYVIPLMYALIVVVLAMGFYTLPLISRFYLKTKDVIRLSFYYSIAKFKITLLNISAIIIGGFVIYRYTTIAMIFVASGVCYLIMYYEKDLLKELEDQMKKENPEDLEKDKEERSSEDRIFSDKVREDSK